MDTLDILIKLEFPSIPSGWGLTEYLLTETTGSNELIFRFNYDTSFVRYGLGAISALFLPKLAQTYEESEIKKTDYDISTLWSALVHQLDETQRRPLLEVFPPWIESACKAIEKGSTQLASSGVGGTYFVSENGRFTAVFKPTDEEPGAPNNPKTLPDGFIPMLPWGKGANREVAASRLGAFVNVPDTHLVQTKSNQGVIKSGSLQKYVDNDGDCSDIGANKFSVETVHRLGIFDITVLNMDRNDENLLVQKSDSVDGWSLIPIDHTYCFPSKVNSYFNWQYWNQARKPFSEETLNIIASIDPLVNAQLLLDLEIEEESVRNVVASTLLLQSAAKKGYNLFQVASMVSGKENDLVDIISATVDKEKKFYEAFYGGNVSFISLGKRLSNFRNICEAVIVDMLQSKNVY